MLYIALQNGVPTGNPIVHENLLHVIPSGILHPTRLPVPDDLLTHGFTVYHNTTKPVASDHYHVVEEGNPILGDDRAAYQTWVEREMTDEEKDRVKTFKTNKQHRIRYAKMENTRWLIERHTDQIALGITPTLTQEQLTEVLQYREALRNVDYSDPFNVTWPTRPLVVEEGIIGPEA